MCADEQPDSEPKPEPEPEPASKADDGGDSVATAAPPVGPEPGELVAGRWRITERLGAGGMGCACLAVDEQGSELGDAATSTLANRVVVKVLPASILARPDGEEARRRFLSSAALQARLALPGVAVVRDFGEEDSERGARPWLVMPHDPERRTLREVLDEARDHKLSWQDGLALLRSIAETLRRLHDRGVVHRDIKPSNVLVRRRAEGWETQLIDFGIAKDLGGESLTRTGESPGFSPQYGAPELHRSSGDPRSDLFSLGVTVLEVMTGQCLHAKGPNDFSGLRVPAALHTLIRSMTDTDPEARPASAAEVLRRSEGLEHRIWPIVLAATAVIALIFAGAWLGQRRIGALQTALVEARRDAVNQAAELKLLREKLARPAPPPVVAKKDSPHPALASLERYQTLLEAERRRWQDPGKPPSREELEQAREAWADLAQQTSVPAVHDAAGLRAALLDTLGLQRRYRLELIEVVKPFDPGQGELYLDLRCGGDALHLEPIAVARKDGITTLTAGENVEAGFELPLTGRGTLEVELSESRWAMDKSLFKQPLELVLPPRRELFTDGLELTLAGPDGLRLTLRVRRL